MKLWQKVSILSKTNKEKIISQELVSAISAYVQSMEIRTGGKKVFEGYDGIKYGAISKDVVVPDWFKGRYISAGLCDVSIYW